MKPFLFVLLLLTLNFKTAHAEAALSKTAFDKVELAVEKPVFLSNRKRRENGFSFSKRK